MNEIICPKCQTKNEADSVYCIECKNVLDLNQYIESKKLKDSGLSKLKSSIGIKTKENKINDEIEEFIILFQKFSKYDEDLKELKSEFINEKSAKKFKEKYQEYLNEFNAFKYLDTIKEDNDLNDNIKELNKIKNNFRNIDSEIKDFNDFYNEVLSKKEKINKFYQKLEKLKELKKSISVNDNYNIKDEFKDLFVFLTKPEIDTIKNKIEFKSEINKFLKDYENFDQTISKINEKIEKNKYLNQINSFNNDLDNLGNSKYHITVVQKNKIIYPYKELYDYLNSPKSSNLNLNYEDKTKVNVFIKEYKNLDSTVDEINREIELNDIKQKLNDYLDQINLFNNQFNQLKNSNSLISADEQSKIKSQYDGCYNNLKIHLLDLNLDEKTNTNINQFLEDYENLNKITEEINKEIKINEINQNIDSYLEKINSFNNDLNQLKNSNSVIVNPDEILIKENYNEIYNTLNIHKTNLNVDSESDDLIKTFLTDYKNLDGIIEKVNENIKLKNLENELYSYINDIELFNTELNKFKNSNIIINSSNIHDLKIKYLKHFNNLKEYDSRINFSNETLNQINTFLKEYDNLDETVIEINKQIKIMEIEKNIKYFLEKIDSFNKILNEKRELTSIIRDSEKDNIKNKYQDIYDKIKPLSSDLKLNSEDKTKIELFIKEYSNLDSIIFELNKEYESIKVRKDINLFNDYLDKLDKLEFFIDFKKKDQLKEDYINLSNEISNLESKYNFKLDTEIHLYNLDNLDTKIEDFNSSYVNKELMDNQEFFDDIDGKSLDTQQRLAVVVDEFNNQIIAGAGSGKTLTVTAKVRYLIEKKGIKPNEILCLSYSRASVNDLIKRLPEGIDAFTFHKLGKTILKDNGEVSNPDDAALENFIKQYFKEKVIHNQKLSEKILNFYAYYFYNPIGEDEASSLGELYDMEKGRDFTTLRSIYGGDNDKITLDNKKVKSLEELVIANFFFINGINYEYEKEYMLKNKNYEKQKEFLKNLIFNNIEIPEQIKEQTTIRIMDRIPIKEKEDYDYKPDFYLIDYDIYLEHFGVNRNCDALWLDKEGSQKYKEGIVWKREFHHEKGTKLLETYSYYMQENRLLDRLKEKLINENVEFGEINYSKIMSEIAERDEVNKFKDFMKLITNFIELFKGNNYKIEKFDEFKNENDTKYESENEKFKKERNALFLDIVENAFLEYEKYLQNKNKIDFNDMINHATDLVKQSKFEGNYKYIIVDEYQDTSHTRYQLLKSIQNEISSKVCVVGDDWQSIYRFSGCDVTLFSEFENYFEHPEIRYIENTYRNSQELIDISANFVKKNPMQTQKSLQSQNHLENPIKIAYYNKRNKSERIKVFEFLVNEASKTSPNILVLGRNNFDIEYFIKDEKHDSPFTKTGKDKNIKLIYSENPDLNINYRTVHGSKGLEEDNVILINLENKISGFPNQKVDDEVLNFVVNTSDQYDFAEERRLFYVALTRTKNITYLLVPNPDKSVFIKELEKEDENIEILDKKITSNINIETNEDLSEFMKNKKFYSMPTNLNCPKCKTGIVTLKVIQSKFGGEFKFFDCSQERCDWDGGRYYSDIKFLDDIEICPKCGGVLTIRNGKYGPFKSCSNYPECKNHKNLNENELEKANEIFSTTTKYKKTENSNYKKIEENPKPKNNTKIEKIPTKLTCPKCGKGTVTLETNNNEKVFRCSEENCDWNGGIFNQDNSKLESIEYCTNCDGIMYPRNGKKGLFLGCSKYPKCTETHSIIKTEETDEVINNLNIELKTIKNKIKELDCNIFMVPYKLGGKGAKIERVNDLDKIMKKLPKNSDDILILGIKDYSSTKLVNNDLFIREGNIKLYDYFKIKYYNNPDLNIKYSTIKRAKGKFRSDDVIIFLHYDFNLNLVNSNKLSYAQNIKRKIKNLNRLYDGFSLSNNNVYLLIPNTFEKSFNKELYNLKMLDSSKINEKIIKETINYNKEIKKTPIISENINIENNSTKILKNQIKNLNTNIELKTYNAGEKPTKKEDVINEIDKIISELPPNSTDILLLSIKDNTINRLKGDEINTESDNWDNNFLKINYRKNPSINFKYSTIDRAKNFKADNVILFLTNFRGYSFLNNDKFSDEKNLENKIKNLNRLYEGFKIGNNNVYLLVSKRFKDSYIKELNDII